MKEWGLFFFLAIVLLSGCNQEADSYKKGISYDADLLSNSNVIAQIDSVATLNNVYTDDLEFCIKYKGGEEALVKYLVDSFKLPADDKHHNISGKVLASFTVNEKGEVGDIKIEEGLYEEIDNEVIIVISEMPKWIWDCETKPSRSYKTKRFAPFIIH